MAVRTYCTIVIIVLSLLKSGDFILILLLFCFTNSKMRYCPTAYTIAIAIKAAKPQLVDTIIKSEILLSDISIINEETTSEMTTKNCLLLYPVTDRCKELINFLIVIDKFIFTDLL
jgi:hypothetical protein